MIIYPLDQKDLQFKMNTMINPTYFFALRDDLQNEKQFLPVRAEPKASGWDVRAAFEDRKSLILCPGDYFKIPLGFRAFPEEGWWFQLHPRSSSFAKKYIHNLIGIIDEHYNQEVMWAGQYLPNLEYCSKNYFKSGIPSKDKLIINFGEAIGQIVPIKRVDMSTAEISNEEYDDLCTKRMGIRNGGFGSTDGHK